MLHTGATALEILVGIIVGKTLFGNNVPESFEVCLNKLLFWPNRNAQSLSPKFSSEQDRKAVFIYVPSEISRNISVKRKTAVTYIRLSWRLSFCIV